jgi:hypothetical protein
MGVTLKKDDHAFFPEVSEEIDWRDMDMDRWGSLGKKKVYKKRRKRRKETGSLFKMKDYAWCKGGNSWKSVSEGIHEEQILNFNGRKKKKKKSGFGDMGSMLVSQPVEERIGEVDNVDCSITPEKITGMCELGSAGQDEIGRKNRAQYGGTCFQIGNGAVFAFWMFVDELGEKKLKILELSREEPIFPVGLVEPPAERAGAFVAERSEEDRSGWENIYSNGTKYNIRWKIKSEVKYDIPIPHPLMHESGRSTSDVILSVLAVTLGSPDVVLSEQGDGYEGMSDLTLSMPGGQEYSTSDLVPSVLMNQKYGMSDLIHSMPGNQDYSTSDLEPSVLIDQNHGMPDHELSMPAVSSSNAELDGRLASNQFKTELDVTPADGE